MKNAMYSIIALFLNTKSLMQVCTFQSIDRAYVEVYYHSFKEVLFYLYQSWGQKLKKKQTEQGTVKICLIKWLL